ncbi:uncharacterized protein N7500_007264 [Penicillium coprophilum]|uniref:uncharacterized protein n=1 Tax=Penicillium coprophilum TaxID=36646 RepID=UPI002388782B|nr:uncharacterized protein N7500_007264 [Penicillium coprophilum]KAJ5165434.1 hypothetical protein N7500_007264 [Penicillium coprophilum]
MLEPLPLIERLGNSVCAFLKPPEVPSKNTNKILERRDSYFSITSRRCLFNRAPGEYCKDRCISGPLSGLPSSGWGKAEHSAPDLDCSTIAPAEGVEM